MQDIILKVWTRIWIAALLAVIPLMTFVGCDSESEDTQPTATKASPTIIPPTEPSSALPVTAEILFTSNQDTRTHRWEIYSMDSQGENITRITDSDENHFIMGVDPSRRYIVATRGTEEKKRLWLLDLITGEETPLTDAENHAEGRTFSLDGEWVVFWMVPAGGTVADIYKVKRDGTGLTNLTNTPHVNEGDPAWSHRGDKITFCYNDGNPNRFVLKSMDTDGNNVRTIYDPEDSVATAIFPPGVMDPSWSPDEQKLVCSGISLEEYTEGGNTHSDLWSINAVTCDLTRLTNTPDIDEFNPLWSPNGSKIAFISWDSGFNNKGFINSLDRWSDICTIDPDGTNRNLIGSRIAPWAAYFNNDHVLTWGHNDSAVAYFSWGLICNSNNAAELSQELWQVGEVKHESPNSMSIGILEPLVRAPLQNGFLGDISLSPKGDKLAFEWTPCDITVSDDGFLGFHIDIDNYDAPNQTIYIIDLPRDDE